MLFHSLGFLVFFPLVTFIYFLIQEKRRYLWLLAASYYYYMCWNAGYALLMLLSTLITYGSGLAIGAVKASGWKPFSKIFFGKLLVFLSFASNLGILFFFKYYNFTIDLINQAAAFWKLPIALPVMDILLPVGISFYTFQALSYTVDVYRGDIYAEKNLFRYALFVSFFPQLVAGPIERSKDLLRKLSLTSRFDYERMVEGILLMLWGFFMKLVIADRAAIFVDTVYGDTTIYTGWYLVIATFLFHYQVYCDFAGYSTIAMGAAKILGIDLTENFKAPYLSRSVGEFWRRWHISLGTWFRDYLYFPLGGSRKGKLCKYRNIMIVFLFCGIWHGASLNFLVWGLLNGFYQVMGEILKPLRDKITGLFHLNRESVSHQILQVIMNMALLSTFVPFFRSVTLTAAIENLRSLLQPDNPWILFDGSLFQCGLDQPNFQLLLICLLILIFADLCRYREIRISKIILSQNAWARGLAIGLAASAVLIFGVWGPWTDSAAFIYYQF